MYDDYMQTLLGYNGRNYQNTYEQGENMPYYNYNMIPNNNDAYNYNMGRENYLQENLEDSYPEIYKIVYPMVKKACLRNTRSISKNLLDEMVNDIYNNIEADNSVELNINLQNEVRTTKAETIDNKESKEHEKVAENRQTRPNYLMNDLIRILLIRELTKRPNCNRPGGCPNFPPMRPPRPGGPGPIRPRI